MKAIFLLCINYCYIGRFLILSCLILSLRDRGRWATMNRGGIQWEQLIGIVSLAAVAKIMFNFDEAALLQLLYGTSHRAVGDAAGFGDGFPTWVAAVYFVIAAEQIAVDGKGYGWQLVLKDFSWEHDKGFSFHFSFLLFDV